MYSRSYSWTGKRFTLTQPSWRPRGPAPAPCRPPWSGSFPPWTGAHAGPVNRCGFQAFEQDASALPVEGSVRQGGRVYDVVGVSLQGDGPILQEQIPARYLAIPVDLVRHSGR